MSFRFILGFATLAFVFFGKHGTHRRRVYMEAKKLVHEHDLHAYAFNVLFCTFHGRGLQSVNLFFIFLYKIFDCEPAHAFALG